MKELPMCRHEEVLLPGPDDEERGRGALARCAALMLSLVEVDLRAIGEGKKHYMVEHQVVSSNLDRAEQMREYTQRIRQRHRNRRRKP